MSSRNLNANDVYDAARSWVGCALMSDGSLFTPGKAIWTSELLGQLRELILEDPDEWKVKGRGFFETLEHLLRRSSPEMHQLAAETMYVFYLIVWRQTVGQAGKKRRINQVLGWTQLPPMPKELEAGLTPGIANPGAFWIANYEIHFGFIIEFVQYWKANTYASLLEAIDSDTPWKFKEIVNSVPLKSALMRGQASGASAQIEALLHLVFPDQFEGIVSNEHKRRISESPAFAGYVTDETRDVDLRLRQIREALEAERGVGFSFYDAHIQRLWEDSNTHLWDTYVERTRRYMPTGFETLEAEEINYKLEAAENLAAAREAVLTESDGWVGQVKRGISVNLNNRHSIIGLRDWFDTSPDDAQRALRAIWAPDDILLSERIRSFCDLFPSTVIGGGGTRARVISVLLMGIDAIEYPPFMTSILTNAYELTGFDKPDTNADEATQYEHALGFLDRFIAEAAERGLTLRHKLDAQSIVWALYNGRETENGGPEDDECTCTLSPESEEYGIEDIINDGAFVSGAELEEMLKQLGAKKNIILQGPPGTGKTWLSRRLAFALMGQKDSTRILPVQYHPNMSYEDFVRGFRPLRGDLELADGPFLQLVEAAANEPESSRVLVIEEINRGNPAVIFGEMLTLLEADKRVSEQAMVLTHSKDSEERVHIPPNVYVIGTMNLADRSLALVDFALRRRFAFFNLEPIFGGSWQSWMHDNFHIDPDFLSDLETRMTDLNQRIADDRNLGPDFCIGHSFVTPSPETEVASPGDWLRSIAESEIFPLLDEYWYDNPDAASEAKAAFLRDL